MTIINIKVIEKIEENKFTIGGWIVELSSFFGKIEAFINLDNSVATPSTAYSFSYLFENQNYNYKSEFIGVADNAIQEAFKNWNPSIEKIDVIVRR